MTIQDQWREFICAPDGIGRHLSTIGKASISRAAVPLDLAALQDFLAKLKEQNTSTAILSDAVDLCRPHYQRFCQVDLPALLDALANERVGELAVVGPALKGHPRWAGTILARRTARIPSTHYISRLSRRSFALPENMLVRWLVGSLNLATERMEALVGYRNLPDALRFIRSACRTALDHHWFGQVDMPTLPTIEMLTTARHQRHRGYRIATDLAAQRIPRESSNKTRRWLALLDLLAVNWLEPSATEELFELYALALVLDVLKADLGLGDPVEFGLVMPGRKHVAKFVSEQGTQTLVYFDQSPTTVLNAASRYKDVLDAHEPSMGSRRRPDVTIVQHRTDGTRIVALVEVKDTAEPAYTADSIYKAFGYIHDFQDLWIGEATNPKVILLFPENLRLRDDINPSLVDVALVSSLDRRSLARCLASRLSA